MRDLGRRGALGLAAGIQGASAPRVLDALELDLRAGAGYRLFLANRLRDGFHKVVVRADPKGSFPGVRADLTLWEKPAEIQPLIAFLPLGENRPFYSHKSPSFVEG